LKFEDKIAERIRTLPPYLFAELDRKRDEVAARGVDIIDLGVGDPDLPTPEHIVRVMQQEVADSGNHRYPSYVGLLEFRKAAAQWYGKRFGVELDPAREVITLIGAKEGIAHFPLAFIEQGDTALVPSPAYPVYAIGTKFAAGEPVVMPLERKNGFLPVLEAIPAEVARKAKIMFLNYPNNPTGAVADRGFFEKVIEFARSFDIIVAHDAPYTEMYFGDPPPSFLEAPGAGEVGIEFHSLSKTYNMTGWRVGFAVGNADIIATFGKVKTNIDSGLFDAIQRAGIEALTGDQFCTDDMRAMYRERRDVLVDGLRGAGIDAEPPQATFYVFAPTPGGMPSAEFCSRLLEEAGVVTTPGVGFGPEGEGYFRVALTVDVERLKEVADRIAKIKF